MTTGDHVTGTPREVRKWNADALRAILRANGYQDKPDVSHDTDRELPSLEEYDPQASAAGETADDVRDILLAVDRFRPRDAPLSARQTGQDSTGWEMWDPSYRSSASGESVHRPPGESVFHDHKEGESFGLLGLFAAEQGIITKPWDRLVGTDWWDAVEPDETDVLIGHYTHAYKPNVVKGRTVMFDEFAQEPFEQRLGHGIEGAISYFLYQHDPTPFDDYPDLLENRGDEERRADALAFLAEYGTEVGPMLRNPSWNGSGPCGRNWGYAPSVGIQARSTNSRWGKSKLQLRSRMEKRSRTISGGSARRCSLGSWSSQRTGLTSSVLV